MNYSGNTNYSGCSEISVRDVNGKTVEYDTGIGTRMLYQSFKTVADARAWAKKNGW